MSVLDSKILAVAQRQLGLVTRPQALACGFSNAQIRQRLRLGVWVRIHGGVYRLPGPKETPDQRILGACLAAGPDAVASHRSAAYLFGLIDKEPRPPEVCVPIPANPKEPGVLIRRSRTLVAREWLMRGEVPVTSPPRTLLDLAGCLPVGELEEILDDALRRELVTAARLDAYLRKPATDRRRGKGTLTALLRDRLGFGVPESHLETRMVRLLRTFRLPDPVRQHHVKVNGRSISLDLAYPRQKVGIELDGRVWHTGLRRGRDHARQNAVELLGWTVLRFTWWDVNERRDDVVLTVARALGMRPSGWAKQRNTPRARVS